MVPNLSSVEPVAVWNPMTTSFPANLTPFPVELLNDSAFSIYFNVFNPHSRLYSNEVSEFGISIGLLKFLVQGVGITTLCVFGVIGNVLAIVILASPPMNNSSTSYFLQCLAACDTIVILGLTIIVGIPSLVVFNPGRIPVSPNNWDPSDSHDMEGNTNWLLFNRQIIQYSWIVPCHYVFVISVIGFTGSVFFTMALTIDRFLAVCKPLVASKYLHSWRRARYMSLVLFVLDLLYNLPRWWEFEYFPVKTDIDNLTVYRLIPTRLRTNFYYDTYYVHISYVVLLFLGPVVFLTVFNTIIYRELRRSREVRKTLIPFLAAIHAPIKKEVSCTDATLSHMLFRIVFVFIVCQVVPVSHATYRYATGDVGTEDYVPEVEFLMTFFYVLNCSVNFLIYCVSGTKFRQALQAIFIFPWAKNTLSTSSASA